MKIFHLNEKKNVGSNFFTVKVRYDGLVFAIVVVTNFFLAETNTQKIWFAEVKVDTSIV
jgi:hypothetical protein